MDDDRYERTRQFALNFDERTLTTAGQVADLLALLIETKERADNLELRLAVMQRSSKWEERIALFVTFGAFLMLIVAVVAFVVAVARG